MIGRVERPHGVRGEVRASATGQTLPDLEVPTAVHLGHPVDADLRLASKRGDPRRMVLRFDGVDDREAATALRGATIEVPASRLGGLGEDEYYVRDLVGLSARIRGGAAPLGEVVDVLGGPANDVLVVRRDGREDLLVPFVADAIAALDLAGGIVELNPWLLGEA